MHVTVFSTGWVEKNKVVEEKFPWMDKNKVFRESLRDSLSGIGRKVLRKISFEWIKESKEFNILNKKKVWKLNVKSKEKVYT